MLQNATLTSKKEPVKIFLCCQYWQIHDCENATTDYLLREFRAKSHGQFKGSG